METTEEMGTENPVDMRLVGDHWLKPNELMGADTPDYIRVSKR